MRNLVVIFTVWAVVLSSKTAGHASNGAETSPGFSGRISIGAGYITSTDQLGTTDENKKISSLGGDADWYDDILPLALFNLRYTFEGRGTQVYFGTPQELTGQPALSLGVVQPFSDGSKLDLSVFGNPMSEVWRDPYIVDERRKETREYMYGTRIEYDEILGSKLKASYAFSRLDVNVDDIGDRFKDLERDGYVHDAEIEYVVTLGDSVAMIPGFKLSIGDIDGDANAYLGYRFGCGLRKLSDSYALMLKGEVGWDDYDDKHPIFNETRDDSHYAVFGMFTLLDLFGKDYLSGSLMAGYRYRDSNIGFLNAKTFMSGLMIGTKF